MERVEQHSLGQVSWSSAAAVGPHHAIPSLCDMMKCGHYIRSKRVTHSNPREGRGKKRVCVFETSICWCPSVTNRPSLNQAACYTPPLDPL